MLFVSDSSGYNMKFLRRGLCILVGLIFLAGCTDHQMYLNTIKDLQKEAEERYGKNNGYQYYLAVGDARIWRGMSCGQYYENKVSYDNSNTFAMLYNSPIDAIRENAIRDCAKKVKSGECIIVVEMDTCVLDKNLGSSTKKSTVGNSSNIEKSKKQCEELGFSPQTEPFGNCVLKVIQHDKN